MLIVRPEEVGFSAERLERIPAAMQRFVTRGDLAGTLTVLARHGKVFHCTTTGLMDIESQRPMQPDAIFHIYSMTKPVTVTAVLMLLEEGLLLLDDPVTDWLPDFARVRVYVRSNGEGIETTDLARPITIRDLLTHSAGLSYGFETGHPVDRLYQQSDLFQVTSPAEWVRRLCQLPLVGQPGARFWYSLAHDVLGCLIELISGHPLDVFFQKRLFDPLGMVDTGFWVRPADRDRLATLYAPQPGGGLQRTEGLRPDLTTKPQVLSGGGGLLSTAADYLNFAQMLLNRGQFAGRRLLSRKTFELLTTPHLPFPLGEVACSPGFSMGLGVAVLTDLAQGSQCGSLGSFAWGGAAGTRFWVDPQEDLVGILLAQTLPGFWRAPDIFQALTYAALMDS